MKVIKKEMNKRGKAMTAEQRKKNDPEDGRGGRCENLGGGVEKGKRKREAGRGREKEIRWKGEQRKKSVLNTCEDVNCYFFYYQYVQQTFSSGFWCHLKYNKRNTCHGTFS